MAKTLKQKRTEFLLDTVNYYAENTRRRCSHDIGCYYSPKNAKKRISEGCAIGRHMTPENQLKADRNPKASCVSLLPKSLIPQKLLNLHMDFLSAIQSFHDKENNWGKRKGLSKEGKVTLENLIRRYDLEKEKFSKYLTIR